MIFNCFEKERGGEIRDAIVRSRLRRRTVMSGMKTDKERRKTFHEKVTERSDIYRPELIEGRLSLIKDEERVEQ